MYFSEYPKTIRLYDGNEATIRLLEKTDEEALLQFMLELPPEELVLFRDDVTDKSVIHKWVNNINTAKIIPLIAIINEKIVANWTLHHREYGWTRHHCSIRGVVKPEYRAKGLAQNIIFELLSIAGKMDLERIVIELVAEQKKLIHRLQRIGFSVDAELVDWIKDFRGRYHNKVILSMKLEPAWQKMEAMILDYGTHGG